VRNFEQTYSTSVPNKYYDKLIKLAYVLKHEFVYIECQPSVELDNYIIILNLKLFFQYISYIDKMYDYSVPTR